MLSSPCSNYKLDLNNSFWILPLRLSSENLILLPARTCLLLHTSGVEATGGEALLFALARVRQLRLCLPGVNLIIYKDDLRLMASKPVAAKEGGMKENRDCWRFMFNEANMASCPDSLLISCPIDRLLNAR